MLKPMRTKKTKKKQLDTAVGEARTTDLWAQRGSDALPQKTGDANKKFRGGKKLISYLPTLYLIVREGMTNTKLACLGLCSGRALAATRGARRSFVLCVRPTHHPNPHRKPRPKPAVPGRRIRKTTLMIQIRDQTTTTPYFRFFGMTSMIPTSTHQYQHHQHRHRLSRFVYRPLSCQVRATNPARSDMYLV